MDSLSGGDVVRNLGKPRQTEFARQYTGEKKAVHRENMGFLQRVSLE